MALKTMKLTEYTTEVTRTYTLTEPRVAESMAPGGKSVAVRKFRIITTIDSSGPAMQRLQVFGPTLKADGEPDKRIETAWFYAVIAESVVAELLDEIESD